VQILANRNLGNGSAEVCDRGPAPLAIGGVPGFPTLDFNPNSQAVTDALNDLSCRLSDNTTAPCTLNSRGIPAFYAPDTTVQVCSDTVLGVEMHFGQGDTVLVAQWRDRNGNIGRTKEIVIRVQQP
jgi:hypothetical protein